jgi:anaerobic ribonucleoside-triphosphate reductase
MVFYKIKKRNGSIATFERNKIEHAITQAIKSCG